MLRDYFAARRVLYSLSSAFFAAALAGDTRFFDLFHDIDSVIYTGICSEERDKLLTNPLREIVE